MKSISYGRQEINDQDIAAVVEVLKGDFLTQGPAVKVFEKSFANYIKAPNAVAVTNGTAALHLATQALGVREGQKVLVPSNTFVASANCIRYCGGSVEFIDIDSKNLCLDLNLLERKLKSNPKGTYAGVVAVDFAGFPIDMERLRKIADQNSLWIIEDACHALGAQFRNFQGEWVYSGNCKYADAAVFSFHPVKHITTGEGGIVVAKHPEVEKKLRLLRSHGITKTPSEMAQNDGPWYYEMQALGYNYRLPDLNCALGITQLSRIESNLKRRRAIAAQYTKELQGIDRLRIQEVDENVRHSYHLFVVHTEKRADFFSYLKERNIHCQVHYIPVHTQPYYQNLVGKVSLPESESHYKTALSLPMYHGLTTEEQIYVIENIKRFFNG